MKINIVHLYPDLLNLYGDKGNIATLTSRLEWRGIEWQVTEYTIGDDIDFDSADIVLLGGGGDRELQRVREDLSRVIDRFKSYVDRGGVVLALCGGYELLGEYCYIGEDKTQGLGILDIHTDYGKDRFIGDVVIKTEFSDVPVVGFENHGGRTCLGSCMPLGKVLCGKGNNGEDMTEGVIYKNLIGTYLHGPVLPKNPHLCDRLLEAAVKNKDSEFVLAPLDDTLELAANSDIVRRYIK